jgi:hypothetical protein
MATASFPNPQTSLRIRTVMIFQPRVPDKECSHVQDLKQYNCMRAHILQCIKKKADQDGSVALQYVVNSANERYKSHPLFPKGACSDLEGSFFVCSGLCLCCINSRGFNAMGPVNLHSLNPWLSRCHQIRPWNSSMFYVILLESSLHVSRELLYHVVSSLFSHVHWLPFGPSRIPGRLTNYVRYTKVACWLF